MIANRCKEALEVMLLTTQCEPKTKETYQGYSVDASIADLLSLINDCGDLKTIASCSGMKTDHCGKSDSAYLSFLREGGGSGEFGMDYNPRYIKSEDIELHNIIKDAAWFPSLSTTYFKNTVTARMFPILPEWRVIGKKTQQQKTEQEEALTKMLIDTSSTVRNIPDEIKRRKWFQLARKISTTICPAKKDVVESMFLYGDDYEKALARSRRWNETEGTLTEEDQVSEEKLDDWGEILDGIS